MKEKIKDLFRPEIGSVLLIIFGAVLLFNPDFGSAAVSAIVGWVLIALGIIGLLIGIFSWPGLGLGEMIGSGILLGAGVYLLQNRLMLASLLGVLFGLLLAGQGLGALRDALRVKHCGGLYLPGMILGILMLALGVFLVFSPMATSRFVWIVAGIGMIASGIGNLVSHYKANKYISGSGADTIIDADN